MSEAPVCHVSVNQVIAQPPPVKFPSVPKAIDLNSALAAINALSQIVMHLAGQQAASGTPGPRGARGATGQPAKKAKPGRWVEQQRNVETVRIENPTDSSQFVEIERINALTMRDSVTGETWAWSRKR